MVACAKYLGREIDTCTRGESCICKKEQTLQRMADILLKIGYPCRGSEEEQFDIFDAANFIQSNFTSVELEDLIK